MGVGDLGMDLGRDNSSREHLGPRTLRSLREPPTNSREREHSTCTALYSFPHETPRCPNKYVYRYHFRKLGYRSCPVCPAPPGVFGLSNALHSGLHATLAIELWASCSRLRAPACSQTLIFGRTECHTPAQGGTSVSARTPPPFRACVLSAFEIWTSISRLGLCTGTV